MSVTQGNKAARFRELHASSGTFIIPNPWDAGSARVLAGLGFEALATSSGASAGALGRRDGRVSREEALAHAKAIVEATDLPVSADLEKGFGDSPEVVAETVRLAAGVGLVGGSIEDATGDAERPLYDLGQATERVAAAVEAARRLPFPFMLTARVGELPPRQPEPGRHDPAPPGLRAAGADVLFAPFLPDLAAVREVCARGVETGELHGRHQGEVVHRGGARGGGSEARQPRQLALPDGHDGARDGSAGGEGSRHLRLPRWVPADGGPDRPHGRLTSACRREAAPWPLRRRAARRLRRRWRLELSRLPRPWGAVAGSQPRARVRPAHPTATAVSAVTLNHGGHIARASGLSALGGTTQIGGTPSFAARDAPAV